MAGSRASRQESDAREPRRALVTGASSGIGEATARLLSREGYRVALLARRGELLEELARELASSPGGAPLVLVADVRDPAALERAFARLEGEFGALELVVSGAGIGYRARVEELEPEPARALLETNVLGPLLVARLSLPLLRRGTRPVLVQIGSVVGRRGIPGQAAYSASKAALASIGEALRLEWAEHGIAVCTLAPALTSTGFFEAQANPHGLAAPDLARADGPEQVAAEILALDRRPRPERALRWKWTALAALSLLAPRLADRLLVRRLGGEWRPG